MRSTVDILIDVKNNVDVDKEELKLALLVLDAINFFNHNHIKRLLKGGTAANLTHKDFPGSCKDLGISESELKALNSDPISYLGPDHIPGTLEWNEFHQLSLSLLDKFNK